MDQGTFPPLATKADRVDSALKRPLQEGTKEVAVYRSHTTPAYSRFPPPNQPKSPSKNDVLSTQEALRAGGATYRFHLPKTVWSGSQSPSDERDSNEWRSEIRHFDVFCDWDAELDSTALSRELQYQRLYYTWHQQRRTDSDHVQGLRGAWQELKESGSAAVEQVVAWLQAVRPRSVHDYKPLLQLLHGVLRVITNHELELYSEQLMAIPKLQSELKEAVKMITEMRAELNKVEEKSKRNLWKDAKGEVFKVLNFKDRWSTHAIQTLQKEVANMVSADDLERHKKESEEKQKKSMDKKIKQSKEIQRLRGIIDEKDGDIEDMRDEMKRYKDKIKLLEEKSGDQARRIEELLEERAVQESKSSDLNSDVASRKKRESRIKFQKASVEKQLEQARGAQDAAKAITNTPFFAWATFHPLVEMEWASVLINNQSSISVPWTSTITLPKTSMLPNGCHVVDIPGGTMIETPEETDKIEEHIVALPAHSKVIFPPRTVAPPPITNALPPIEDAEGAPKPSGPAITVSHVTVPGGTSIVMPPLERKVTIMVAPGTVLYSPVDEDSVNKDENIRQAPRGLISTMSVVGGTTVVTPMGLRSQVHVPTGSTFVFPKGQKCDVSVPAGSKLVLKADGGYSIAMCPVNSKIYLPDHGEGWKGEAYDPEDNEHVGTNSNADTKKLKAVIPECCIRLPGGSVVSVPSSHPLGHAEFDCTVPKDTCVIAPRDEWGVPATKGTWTAGRYAQSGKVVLGSEIRLKEPLQTVHNAALLASRMFAIGAEATGAAIACIDTRQVATSMSDDALSAQSCAQVLSYARPVAAAEIIRIMDHNKVREMLEFVSTDVLASILAVMPDSPMADIVQLAFSGDEKAQADLVKKRKKVTDATTLLNTGTSVSRCVDAVTPLDPIVGARLLADAAANKAANVLGGIAGQVEPRAQVANLCAEELTVSANIIRQISIRLVGADIIRARLLEQLARARTEQHLLEGSVKVMRHLREAYGVSCTLARMPLDDDVETNKAVDDIVAETKGKEKKQFLAKSKTMKKKGLPATARMRTFGPRSRAARKAEEAEEEAAAERIELLASNEDVRWDMPGGDNLPGQKFSEQLVSSGLAVEMSLKVLCAAQEEALSTQKPVLRGVLLVVPIILGNGHKWGTLSHIDVTAASPLLLGGLGRPANRRGKVVPHSSRGHECLDVFAQSVGFAMENIEKVTKEQYKELLANKDSIGFDFNTTFEPPPGADPLAPLAPVDMEAISMELQSYTYWRRRVIGALNLDFRKEVAAAEEIRSYQNPPYPIVLLMTSLFLILDIGIKGFKDILGPSMLTLAKDDDKKFEQWKHCKSLIKIDPTDPQSLPALMTFESKGIVSTSETLVEDDINDLSMRLRPVGKMMMILYDEQFQSASTIVTKLMEWTFVQFKIKDIQLRIAKSKTSCVRPT